MRSHHNWRRLLLNTQLPQLYVIGILLGRIQEAARGTPQLMRQRPQEICFLVSVCTRIFN